MLTDIREPSLQIRAYLKRMALNYADTPEAERSEEIEALMDALRTRERWNAPDELMERAALFALSPDTVSGEEVEALLDALSRCGPAGAG